MKLRLQHDRRASTEIRSVLTHSESTVMLKELISQDGTALSVPLQPGLLTGTPESGPGNALAGSEDQVPVIRTSTGEENNPAPSSHRHRAGVHSHSRSCRRSHTHTEPESDPSNSDPEAGESSVPFSELRHLFYWLQKSLPFIVVLGVKLILQHALGLAVGVALFTTFLYVNKSIQTQVFLQDRRSKLQCFWLLSFLIASATLLYYTFQKESLYFCLILIYPNTEPVDFWKVLWAVGVTSFIVKFLFMAFKCIILLLPTPIMSFRTRGRWYMFIEELGQVYQITAPVPPWFHYLVSSQEAHSALGFTLGILLAVLYVILKLLGLYTHWGSLKKTLWTFLSNEMNGAPATQSQCTEAGELCVLCQTEFKHPRVLLCQHVFCEDCIGLWVNQEKACPLCRTIITDKVHKWKDGATSPYLQVY